MLHVLNLEIRKKRKKERKKGHGDAGIQKELKTIGEDEVEEAEYAFEVYSGPKSNFE